MAEEQVNEQLKQALRKAGLEIDDLAANVEVDIRTAYRWLTQGRTPYPRHRRRVADALGVPEQLLWPNELPDQDGAGAVTAGTIEVLGAGQDGADWRELLASARERVDLIDLTLGEVISDGDGQLLAAVAKRGCRVRVMVSDPESIHLAIAEEEAGDDASLMSWPASTAELDRVTGLLKPHLEGGQLELRTFVGAGAYRVLIFDDQALVRLRLPGITDLEAMPLLYLTRQSAGGTFDSFSEHFQALWQIGETLR
jgi:lambda repressor-like predicted transcriptional regulator